jgi:hypothetical protein
MTPSATFETPKIVAGAQKLAQRFIVLFTTTLGSDKFNTDFGTKLTDAAKYGNTTGYTDIELMANMANEQARDAIFAADADTDTYGAIPDDEKLANSWISDVVVDKDTRTVRIYVSIVTAAGEAITFVVPTTSGIY